jgi:uncharacterized protein (DUF433 family)
MNKRMAEFRVQSLLSAARAPLQKPPPFINYTQTGEYLMATPRRRRSSLRTAGFRATLSLREAVVLADVPEARIRKDIETGLLSPIKGAPIERLLFRWVDAFVFAAVYRGELFSAPLRKKAFAELEGLVDPSCRRHFYRHMDFDTLMATRCTQSRPSDLFGSHDRLKLDKYLFIDVAAIAKDLAPRVDLYAEGLSRIEEKEGVLGGEAVFKGTRLSVNHIGKMRDKGEALENIMEDYPYLRKDDIEFARLYFKAHPTVGRPPRKEEISFARNTSPR